jgi:RNA polymerase sigma factor for flagellar operon FliA
MRPDEAGRRMMAQSSRKYGPGKEAAVESREQLILEHLPQVRLIARRIHERLPESVALEDLISTGIIGLISAVDGYDAAHNVKLKTYAEYKIRGAILDSLRDLDWAPRQKRKMSKKIEAAISVLEQHLKRSPTEEEIANQLDMDLPDYQKQLIDIQGLTLGSLEYSSGDDEGRELVRVLADHSEELPSEIFEKQELQRVLAKTIEGIPQIEREILSLYYQHELTLREIARIVGLHESRISQLKSQSILRLRSAIQRIWSSSPR